MSTKAEGNSGKIMEARIKVQDLKSTGSLGNFVESVELLLAYAKENPEKVLFDEKDNVIIITGANPLNKSKHLEFARLPLK